MINLKHLNRGMPEEKAYGKKGDFCGERRPK